mmetsp:Transcript_16557/g.50127  ORF Transcript_16557/g.50127 Transcript_16557/m.50127 type:complete len:163 (+) Transcript_16557:1712-2200(+)
MPVHGVKKEEYYRAKFGARVSAIQENMKRVFASEGLEFKSGGVTGPTLNSHRLIAYAETFGSEKQNALVEELMLNYFGQEKYINDPAVLLAAAEKVGLPDARAVVQDDTKYRDTVIEQYHTYARGVSGVPHFIISDGAGKSVELSGAQDVDTFASALAQVSS